MDFSFYLTHLDGRYLGRTQHSSLCSSLLLSRRKRANRDGTVKGKVLNVGSHKGLRLRVQVAGALPWD